VTEFIFDHPGGEELILQYAGKDVTEVMKDPIEHLHSEAAYEILEQYYIGDLDSSSSVAKKDKPESMTAVSENEKSEKFIDVTKPMLAQVWRGNFSKEFYLRQVHIPRHTKESAPIFGSPYLEVLTKTPWYVIPIVWVPVSLYFCHLASLQLPSWQVSFYYMLGIANWSLLEYMIHRFVFHIDSVLPDNRIAITAHYLMHGIHHFLPMDR
jgi:4-hydroxysphinganine ceramide fatty acyl 2-hydroxylase